jgi:lantibiotic biosynthesis protein
VYEYLDAAVVRAPAWQPQCQGLPWPDLTGPESWRAWLSQAWQVTEFACALEAASPDLAHQVARIRDGRDVPEAAVRRAVLSTLRYLLRASSRATPFGLLAGVAAARFGTATVIRAGTGHRAMARADATWVTAVIERLEADPGLLPHLTVIASSLAVERGGHLVIEHRPRGSAGGAPERVRVRAARPVLAALEAAQWPIRVADLAAKLSAISPDVPGDVIRALIARLVEQRFLITSFRVPMTDPDPLTALLRELDVLPLTHTAQAAALRAGLHAIRAALADHDSAPGQAAARSKRAQASALMTGPPARTTLAIDLRLDWDLVLPETIPRQAGSAAALLARLARRPALSSGWVAWHARFLDRYGPGAVVPVLDVVNADTGLGYPAGYLGSPHAAPVSPLTDRDKSLLKLAHNAAMRGHREIVLDDALVGELAVTGPGDPVQPSTELTVRVHAASARDLDEGRYELHVTGASRAAGTITGRFLPILDAGDRERMTGLYAALPGVHRGSLPVQVSAAPLHASTENVTRSLQAAGLVISVGEHDEPGPGRIPVADLAVTADAGHLHLVSVSRRHPVHTVMLNAVDLAFHSQPLARFLVEAPAALAAPCTGFEWGAASALPFLPALRYGRTVVSPARWMLTTADLPGKTADWPQWDEALAAWRGQVRLPEWAYLGDGDQCIRLHLAEPSHRALLRDHLNRVGRAMLRTAPSPDDLGWADGRAHEIVIPVIAAGQAAGPVRWPGEVTSRNHGHLPGCDGRLYLKLHGHRDQQDAILTRHLPRLVSQAGRWWFIRYGEPGDHLRLRLALGAGSTGIGPAIEQVCAWTGMLRCADLITHVTWETYYPETARFGGTGAMDAAEGFFAADSAAALAELAACGTANGPDPRALTAASLVDIAVGVIGDQAGAMRWLAGHTAAGAVPPPRALYDQAVALVNEPGALAMDAGVTDSWAGRRSTLAAYRSALEQAGTVSPVDLIPDLLHLHHARMTRPDLAAERACLHLARAAALSWLARARKAP